MFITDSIAVGGIFLLVFIVVILAFLYAMRRKVMKKDIFSKKASLIILIIALIIGFSIACMFLLTYGGIYQLLPEDVVLEKSVLASLLLICFVIIIFSWRSIRSQPPEQK